MINFKLTRKATFRYDTASEGDITRVEISYKKGGMNYFSYQNDLRGIYVSIGPVKLEKRDGCMIQTVTSFSHQTYFVKELKMQAPRQLEGCAEFFDSHIPAIASQYQQDKNEAVNRLYELVNQYKNYLQEVI